MAILLRSLPVADPSRFYRVGDRGIAATSKALKTTTATSIFSHTISTFSSSSPRRSLSSWRRSRPADQLQRAQRIVAGQTAASRICFGKLLLNTRRGRVCGPAASRQRRQTWSHASSRLELPNLAGGLRRRSRHGGFHDRGADAPVHRRGHCAAGLFGDRVVSRPPDLWVPLANEPMIEGAGYFAAAARANDDTSLALSPGQGAAGDQHSVSADEAFRSPAAMDGPRPASTPMAARP